MRKMFSVLHYEYKMQFKRLVTWGVLLVATALSLLDNFPSAGNLARLEFLNEPSILCLSDCEPRQPCFIVRSDVLIGRTYSDRY